MDVRSRVTRRLSDRRPRTHSRRAPAASLPAPSFPASSPSPLIAFPSFIFFPPSAPLFLFSFHSPLHLFPKSRCLSCLCSPALALFHWLNVSDALRIYTDAFNYAHATQRRLCKNNISVWVSACDFVCGTIFGKGAEMAGAITRRCHFQGGAVPRRGGISRYLR